MNMDSLCTETLAEALTPLSPTAEARAQWLARLRGPERFSLFAVDLVRLFGLRHSDALDALRLIQTDDAWVPGQLPESRLLTTPALSEHGAVITRLPPGTRLPRHTHATRETTFVLDGCLIENGVARHGAGATLDMQVGSEHELQVADDEHCLVVFSKR